MSQIEKKNQEFVKTNSHVLEDTTNQEFGYWKSLKDISSEDDYNRFLKQSEHNVDNGLSRRNFLSLIAASVALAGLEGCKKPVQKIIPYVEAEIGTIPGIPKYYASTLPFKNNALGVVIENHDERPVKVEGNEKHPTTLGKSNSFAQASTLEMYDPDRARGVKFEGNKVDWNEYLKFAKSLNDGNGKGLAVLMQESSSPTIKSIQEDFKKNLPNADWVVYESVNNENLYDGIGLAFSKRLQPLYRLEKAQIIVSLGSDFLGVDDNNIYHTRKFAQNRNIVDENSTMNRLYVAESSISSTGSSADHRLNVPQHEMENLLAELAYELKQLGLRIEAKKVKSSNNLWVKAAAKDLFDGRGESIIIGGSSLSKEFHQLIALINYNLKAPVDYYPLNMSQVSSIKNFESLCNDMKNGKINNLIILGANPVYDSPADFDFAESLKKVKNSVHLTNIIDETSKLCSWNIAMNHYFECWGDAMTYDGHVSIVQPQIMPLFDSKSIIQILSPIVYSKEQSAYDTVKNVWKSNIIKSGNFDREWDKVLHDGLYKKPIFKKLNVRPASKISTAVLNNYSLDNDKFEIVFCPSSSVYDGRYANNGWLQEIPKPITSLTWDNAALISMKVAKKLNIKNGQMLEISVGDNTINIPAFITPGQNQKSITLELGYGRKFNGRIGNEVGFNVYPLRSSDSPSFILNGSIKVLNETYPLASTQDHHGLEDDKYAAPGFDDLANKEAQSRIPELVKQSTFDYYKDNPDWVQKKVEQHKPDKNRSWADHSMYNPDWDYSKGPQWGMSIDLTSCTSCNACSIACQSENNIPVVGKQQVMNGREMHWIRIDNYFAGDPDNPEVSTQSVACVHCELAPCESVCPVAATTHSSDGVNQMTYNRCLGTRYCANNCPYKVRKFNFYNYTKDLPEVVQMAMNPDVSIRFRGVMEKCTYCYQRISSARITAENEGREIKDGDFQVACQQSCPADAIKFGDINDPNSEVSKAKRRNRDYALLAHLGTAPRTTYLAKIRNQNPMLVSKSQNGSYQ
ncbi:Fe-S-cluster-containing hydrogenase [Candidatus Marinimicrobia bacterium]|nr:Fe-S-cluster-containing hydrogenase [Candidatus Neomarinimicrobiota bacterium]MDA9735409.1 Fe-S-cluster-containing hydrogenase [Candidatus Neomarinimicrobiota bacterium]